MKRLAFLIAVCTLIAPSLVAQDFLSMKGPKKLVRIDQHLDRPIPLDLQFKDEAGRDVKLGDYFGKKPVVLTLVYFSCPMLCNMVLDGMTTSMSNIRAEIGSDYEVLAVSFDPADTPKDAAEKKDIYARRYGRAGAQTGWHFLTGKPDAIQSLTSAVGFQYFYDEKAKQFAHGAALIVLTPDGKIARYFYGITYRDRDLRLALVEASKGKIGTLTDEILLLCYHYDPATGKYAAVAMNFVRAGGVATILLLAGFVFISVRREHHKALVEAKNNSKPNDGGLT